MKLPRFEHTVLREELVVGATWLSDAATQFIMMILANSGIRPSTLNKTVLFPAFLFHLTDEDRALLFGAHEQFSDVEAETTSDRVHMWMAAVATTTALIENMLLYVLNDR